MHTAHDERDWSGYLGFDVRPAAFILGPPKWEVIANGCVRVSLHGDLTGASLEKARRNYERRNATVGGLLGLDGLGG